MTGGNFSKDPQKGGCERYDLKVGLWSRVGQLREPRDGHSSCVAGQHVYVFCGKLFTGKVINSIEQLDIQADIKDNLHFWVIVKSGGLNVFRPRKDLISIAISETEVLIMGGLDQIGKAMSNKCIFDTQELQIKDTRSLEQDNSLGLLLPVRVIGSQNSSVVIPTGDIIAMAYAGAQYTELKLISHTPRSNRIETLFKPELEL